MSYGKPEVTVLASGIKAIQSGDLTTKYGAYQDFDFAHGHDDELNQSVIGAYESDE